MIRKTFILLALCLFVLNFTANNNSKDYEHIITVKKDNQLFLLANSAAIFEEKWDTLAHPQFWRTLMKLPGDSGVINIASTRQIITKIAIADWDTLTDEQKDLYRQKIRAEYNVPEDVKIYMTSGKKEFYRFDKALPSIHKAVQIFDENCVDPFYAQAILLIESPNKLQKSPVGAYGSFQLMKKVAINMGLKVNKYVDERKDFDKSAWAAAKLIKTICIPETNKMLDEFGICYQQDELWYRLLVLHVYHAGAYNVKKALDVIQPTKGGKELITTLWQTKAGNFGNASQNYSQVALASLIEFSELLNN